MIAAKPWYPPAASRGIPPTVSGWHRRAELYPRRNEGVRAALGRRPRDRMRPNGGSGTAANIFCGPAEHFCVDAEGFCIARGDFCVDAEPFCIDANHFCVDAEPFCVDAKHFCIDAEHICIDANVSVRGSRKCRCSANAAGRCGELRGTRGETPRKFKVQMGKGSRRNRRRGVGGLVGALASAGRSPPPARGLAPPPPPPVGTGGGSG
jgi:hypothetical protein